MSKVILLGKDDTIDSVVVGIDNSAWFVSVFKSADTPSDEDEQVPIVWKHPTTQAEVLSAIEEYADMKNGFVRMIHDCVGWDLDPGQFGDGQPEFKAGRDKR